MGDRGQVLIKDTGVYLYTHWGATELYETVKNAIRKKWRWNDPEYLARIIFDEMTKGVQGRETGYGIGTKMAGDIWRLVIVDCKKFTVTVEDEGKIKKEKTFQQICEEK